MFFRRMFSRKDDIGEMNAVDDDEDDSNDLDETDENDNNRNWSDFEFRHNRRHTKGNGYRNSGGPATAPAGAMGGQFSDSTVVKLRNITTSGALSSSPSLQLTPLWEHILRTRTIPESICPAKMFAEFNERLRDPEWQVRQHALRVFVDVLVVMRALADNYMEKLIPQLVENLGHPAPTVRKGALDCLRVYLSETAMPETIMLQVLDIGLNQKITNEPFGGRLTCGVMLSLPALLQTTLQTTKRHFILRSTIDMLVQKMGQVTHQEITLKVLSKIRELIGEVEFAEFMSHVAYREYELLCSVYGVGLCNESQAHSKTTLDNGNLTWRYITEKPTLNCWRSSDEEQMLDCAAHGKVIMETEIKINDDTLTMRILEAKDDVTTRQEEVNSQKSLQNEYPNSLEDEVVCGRLASARSEREITGVIHVLSDSEVEDNNKKAAISSNPVRSEQFTVVTPSTPLRTPKRVTFGGEIVKMRTPDSDATNTNSNSNSNENYDNNEKNAETTCEEPAFIAQISSPTTDMDSSISPSPEESSKTTELSVEIPNDNTKPLQRPRTAQSPKKSQKTEADEIAVSVSPLSLPSSNSPPSPIKRRDSTNSLSPRSPFKHISISPVDGIISPKTQHKEIEVLHNLQRDPSPIRIKSARSTIQTGASEVETAVKNISNTTPNIQTQETLPPPKSWEELGIVDYDTLADLRSGNWRYRLQGIIQLEEALRSSDNLSLVQPCLATLLRTLLSSERNHEVAEAKHRLLTNLISRLPLDNLEDRAGQIMTGLCRQGGAGANRVCKALMQRLLPAVIVLKLISQEFLHAKSSRFREHALQMVMHALMTFPSTCFDTKTCITNATFAVLNRKRRVRQAALEVLAILGQVTTGRSVMDIVENFVKESKREDGAALVAAVKARLSRKQLPIITAEGVVQYTLRLPSATEGITAGNGQLGPDIEWITAGVGSVSPTSMRRRAYKARSCSQQSFCCVPAQGITGGALGHYSDGGCSQKNKPILYLPDELYEKDVYGNRQSFGLSDDNQSYKLQHVLGNNFTLTSKKPNVDLLNYKNRRLVDKSCSDSSMEGRSSDSTYTSSDGKTAAVGQYTDMGCGGGISGRFTRQPVNSRFPTMDFNSTCARVHRPPTYYPGMGAYAHLQQQQYNINSTYPKINYTLPPHQSRRSHQMQQQVQYLYHNNNNNNNNNKNYQSYSHQQQQQQLHKGNAFAQESFKQTETYNKQQKENANENVDDLDGTYTICQGVSDNTNERISAHATKAKQQQQLAARRFVNVDKLIPESNNKSPPSNGYSQQIASSPENQNESKQATPVSAKSTTYSQKSTASARSSRKIQNELNEGSSTTQHEMLEHHVNSTANSKDQNPMETEKESIEVEKITIPIPNESTSAAINRSDSIVSLQSKSESIKTEIDDSPNAVSRTQSMKSLAIEEDIVSNNSFLVIEETAEKELKQENASASSGSSPFNKNQHEAFNDNKMEIENEIKNETKSEEEFDGESRKNSPSIADLKTLSRRNSMIKSMESLYERTPSTVKQDSLDTTTETSSQSSNQTTQVAALTLSSTIPTKSQHTPLKQKAKTSYFLRNHRRVSPVKQSIKMQQPEPFPATLERFDKPKEALIKTLNQLDSTNWEFIMEGLKSMVRLMRYHAVYLETQMHMVCIQLTRSVRNLRSQVARAACQAATEIFSLKSKTLEQECDDLVCALLHRTADTNRFIRADATRALESMCDSLMPPKILNILTTKGALHQNAVVRTTTAKLLNRLAVRLGNDKIYAMTRENRDKFFITGANLLLEGSLETRSYAKSLFQMLSDHPSYNRLLQEVIPHRTYRNIEKTLKNIR